MDTYSAYLALTGESVDNLVTPELREHYFRHRSEWLPSECCDEYQNEYVRCRLADRPWVGDEACCKARKAYDKRTQGLFKVEWSGDGFVGLCSKTYYCFGATDKYSTKGLSKRHNTINKDAFLEVLANCSERKWKEPRVPGASLVRVDVRAGTSGSHLLLWQTRGARGRSEHGSGGRVKRRCTSVVRPIDVVLCDVFVLVIITVVGLVFASITDGEFLIRGDVVEPFVVEHTAIFVMSSLDFISLLVQESGLAIIRSSRLRSFHTNFVLAGMITLIGLRYCLLHTRYGSVMLVLTNQCLKVMLWFLS